MKKQPCFALVTAASLFLLASVATAQDSFFATDFEYADEPFPEDLMEPANLNGAIGQVGEWSGDAFPDGDPSSFFWFDEIDALCCGFEDNAVGGRLLLIDRPVADATLIASLTEEIPTVGAQVSLVVGTRRTGGGGAKDYEIFGLDSQGNESFRLRVDTDAFQRLGYVAGGRATFDLPTLEGEDADGDMSGVPGPPLTEMSLSTITVNLAAGGFLVDFENNQNSYSTGVLANNGSATTLAQVGVSFQGAAGTGAKSGFYLDRLQVSREDRLFGDFDSNGTIEMADFVILTDNYGTGTTHAQGDINLDKRVNLDDFAGLVSAFNAQGQAAAVPEPNSFLLVAISAMLLAVGRRDQRRKQ